MHPILSQARRLAFYLLAWVPFAGGLFYIFTAIGGMSRTEAEVLVPVLCIVYAFACLTASYVCRFNPIGSSSFPRLITSSLLAAGIMSALWTAIARGVARVLAFSATLASAPESMSRNASLLFTAGVMLYLLSIGAHYVLLTIQQAQAVEQRLAEARVLARDAELRALKTQINPHFLFNSLHSISALTSIDPARARDMCVALADFLRLTLGMGEKTVIPLEEELALLRKYLAVEKIRFGARLKMEEDAELATLHCTVPPLILQPLIENAVSHGIANLPEGGWIKLAVHADGHEKMHITVANNFDPETPPRRRNGVGLVNVRQRIGARYGNRAQFAINKVDDRFEVAIEIPMESVENA